jgi:hypothetical protein
VRSPTISQLRKAHKVFAREEARDLFYRVATDLVERSTRGESELSLGEAVAVLLATWNRRFYQRGRRCDAHHVDVIDKAIQSRRQVFATYRSRTIDTLAEADEHDILRHFASFEQFLGPVGTAKCFHLLAPRFFPLWDRSIAAEYGVPLGEMGRNANRYFRFMQTVHLEVERLGGSEAIQRAIDVPALKALDEYAYSRFTKNWL